MFNQNQLLKYRSANFIAEYMEVFTPQARYLSFQHLSLLPLVVHLPLVVAPAHALLHLLLVGPDHQEEVGAKHPPEDAAEGVGEGEADHRLEDVEDVQDEADSRQHDPRFHQTHVRLKYRVDVSSKLFKTLFTFIQGPFRYFWIYDWMMTSVHEKSLKSNWRVPKLDSPK